MSILCIFGLLAVAHLHLSNSRPHSGKSYQVIEEEEERNYSWREAEGYEECEDFLVDRDNLDFEENALNEVGYGPDEQDHFRKSPKPKPLEKICSGYECVPFQKVESSGCGYEERILLRGNWTTTYIDLDAANGYREAYYRLHYYRSGEKTDLGEYVGMAVPVIKRWWLDQDLNVLEATMSFYVPAAFQSNPPASLDPDVRVEEWDEAVIYSRAYGGNREDPEHLKQFDLLKTALAKENIAPYSYMMMTAGYTSPRHGRQRREVILVHSNSM